MKNLVFDARCLASGIGTYGMNLLSRLAETELRDKMRIVATSALRNTFERKGIRVVTLDVPIYSLREQWSVPRVIENESAVHALHYNAPLLHRGPLIVTIHDLTHLLDETYRNNWRSRIYSQPMFRAVAHRADHIFVVSEYVKRCLVDCLNVGNSKITVAPNGVGEEFCPGDMTAAQNMVARITGSSSPYILFVGNLKPHKNVTNLLRAFALLVADPNFEHRLIIVGDDRRGRRDTMLRVRELRIDSRVTLIPRVKSDELVDLYRAADLLVMPSFEEGFGLPVVEAMACGTPVACSRAASLPEVGGDAVEYFDPRAPEDIAAAIRQVLSSPERSTNMSDRGLRRARSFTWDRTVNLHLNIYKQFIPLPSTVASSAAD